MNRVSERVSRLTQEEVNRFCAPLVASHAALLAGKGTVQHYQLLLSMYWFGKALERHGAIAGGHELLDEFGTLMVDELHLRISADRVPTPSDDECDCIRATVELLTLQISACTWAEFCAARVSALGMCKQAGGAVVSGATANQIIKAVMEGAAA